MIESHNIINYGDETVIDNVGIQLIIIIYSVKDFTNPQQK